MIDAKELHIGNHVSLDGVGVFRITDIETTHEDAELLIFGEHISDNFKSVEGYPTTLNEEYLQPIPITPSLLEELGFEHGSDEREWHKDIGEVWIGIHLFLDRERMRVNVCDDTADYGNVIIRYLHELENFVYLTLKRELIEE